MNETDRIFELRNGVAKEVEKHKIHEYTQAQLVEQVSDLLEGQFPLPFVLVLLGYSFILLIDKVLIDAHDTAST